MNNFERIKQMTVDEMALYMCIIARAGIKATCNKIGITEDEIVFPPIEEYIEACKQMLLQEVEE